MLFSIIYTFSSGGQVSQLCVQVQFWYNLPSGQVLKNPNVTPCDGAWNMEYMGTTFVIISRIPMEGGDLFVYWGSIWQTITIPCIRCVSSDDGMIVDRWQYSLASCLNNHTSYTWSVSYSQSNVIVVGRKMFHFLNIWIITSEFMSFVQMNMHWRPSAFRKHLPVENTCSVLQVIVDCPLSSGCKGRIEFPSLFP